MRDTKGSWVQIPSGPPQKMEVMNVVSIFLKHKGKYLILKRSDKVSTFRNVWGSVSGRIENNDWDDVETSMREIEEETGIKRENLRLLRKGEPFELLAEERKWIVHPMLFESLTDKVNLNWENVDFAWIDEKDLGKFKTVEKLNTTLERVTGNGKSE